MADAGHSKTEHLLENIESKLDKVYGQAVDEVGKKLADYMEKNMKKFDMMWDKYQSGEITLEQFQHWANGGLTGQKYQHLLDNLCEDCTHTNQIAMSIVNGYTPEAYALNRNYAMYQLEMGGVELGASFDLYDRHTVEKLVRGKGSLLPKPRVDIPKDKRWNRAHIRNAITQGVLQGESIPKVAKRLEKVVGMNRASAVRNARTAMTGAQNAGRIDSYNYARKELGVKVMKEWQASGDEVTRESHRAISGEQVKMTETFSNGCEYPGDPSGAPEEVYNCRCTLLPYLPDYDFKEEKLGGEKQFDEWVEEHQDDEKKRLEDAIANAQDHTYDWHEENDFSWDVWYGMDEEERDAIESYTGSWYEEMNDALRAKDIFSQGHRTAEKIQDAFRGMSHFKIPEDTKLYRGMGSWNSLSRAMELPVETIEQAIADGSIVGMRFTENGFGSTAATWQKAWHKPIMLDIVAPKGTEGMYVDLISRCRGEKEILLQLGTEFEILEAAPRMHGSGWCEGEVMCLKVVVTGVKKMAGL